CIYPANSHDAIHLLSPPQQLYSLDSRWYKLHCPLWISSRLRVPSRLISSITLSSSLLSIMFTAAPPSALLGPHTLHQQTAVPLSPVNGCISAIDATTVYVGNLPYTLSDQDIATVFSKCGEVLNVTRRKETNWAFVRFRSEQSANLALQADQSEFEGRKLNIRPRKLQTQQREQNSPLQQPITIDANISISRVITVANLPADMAPRDLYSLLENFGRVEQSFIFAYGDAKGRRFGEGLMATHYAAQKALETLNGHVFKGCMLEVGYKVALPLMYVTPNATGGLSHSATRSDVATSPPQLTTSDIDSSTSQNASEVSPVFPTVPETKTPINPCNLYVKNLDDEVVENQEQLKNFFSKYGQIVSCYLATVSGTGISRGFGFVMFSRSEDALAAKEALDSQIVGKKRLFVSYAESKEKREQRLKEFFATECQEKKLSEEKLDENIVMTTHSKVCDTELELRMQKTKEEVMSRLAERLDGVIVKMPGSPAIEVSIRSSLAPEKAFEIYSSTSPKIISELGNEISSSDVMKALDTNSYEGQTNTKTSPKTASLKAQKRSGWIKKKSSSLSSVTALSAMPGKKH
ncbi:mRNA export factor crp79, partial [Neolecta irregularis DAH-3]